MMKGLRVARTRDGRYVPDTDPDAMVLAYNQHHDVPDEVVAKMRQAPQDKQRKPRSRDKSEASQPEPEVDEAPEQPGRPDNRTVREWAAEQGYELSSRGKIPAEVVEAYQAAHGEQE